MTFWFPKGHIGVTIVTFGPKFVTFWKFTFLWTVDLSWIFDRSIFRSIQLSINQSIYLSIYISIYLFIQLCWELIFLWRLDLSRIIDQSIFRSNLYGWIDECMNRWEGLPKFLIATIYISIYVCAILWPLNRNLWNI